MGLEICSIDGILWRIHVSELVVGASQVFHDFQRFAGVLAIRFRRVLTAICRIVGSRINTEIDLASQQFFLEVLLLLVIVC